MGARALLATSPNGFQSARAPLGAMVARLETQGSRAPAPVRAELLYPVERMPNVNRGLLELRTLDVERDFAAAAAVATALDQGRNSFDGMTGDLRRHYLLEAAHEIMPYHMMVPSGYAASKAYPFIIALPPRQCGGAELPRHVRLLRRAPPAGDALDRRPQHRHSEGCFR